MDALNANDNRGRPCSLERSGGILAKTVCIASITQAWRHRRLICWAVVTFYDPIVASEPANFLAVPQAYHACAFYPLWDSLVGDFANPLGVCVVP